MSPENQPTGLALAWCPVPPCCTETGKSLRSTGWCPTSPVIVTKRDGYGISVGLVTQLRDSDIYFYPCVQADPGNLLPPAQWVSNVLFSGAKRPGREADHPELRLKKNAAVPPFHSSSLLRDAEIPYFSIDNARVIYAKKV